MLQRFIRFLFLCLSFSPDRRREQHNHRENFQSSKEHVQTQHDFGKVREQGEILHRTYQGQTWTYIPQGGDDRRDGCSKVIIVYGNQYKGTKEQHHISDEIPSCALNGFVTDTLSFQFDDIDGTWMDNMPNFPQCQFQQNDKTGNLDNALSSVGYR